MYKITGDERLTYLKQLVLGGERVFSFELIDRQQNGNANWDTGSRKIQTISKLITVAYDVNLNRQPKPEERAFILLKLFNVNEAQLEAAKKNSSYRVVHVHGINLADIVQIIHGTTY